MRLYFPFILGPLFVCYILYLFLIKKELKRNLTTIVYPGLFFFLVWALLYYWLVS
ncbi:MAG: hypothetical protein RL427_315 [Bacteroidota bacterium]|jgi:hypothetical protein